MTRNTCAITLFYGSKSAAGTCSDVHSFFVGPVYYNHNVILPYHGNGHISHCLDVCMSPMFYGYVAGCGSFHCTLVPCFCLTTPYEITIETTECRFRPSRPLAGGNRSMGRADGKKSDVIPSKTGWLLGTCSYGRSM